MKPILLITTFAFFILFSLQIVYAQSESNPDSKLLEFKQEFSDEQICGKGNVLVEGVCRPVEPNDFREGETLNSPVIIIIESLGAVLIIGFIVFYAIKKRRTKKENEN